MLQPSLADQRADSGEMIVPLIHMQSPEGKLSLTYYINPKKNESLFVFDDRLKWDNYGQGRVTAPTVDEVVMKKIVSNLLQ